MIVNDPILHYDRRNQRMLDLAPFGVDCIPLLSHSTFSQRRRGTVFVSAPDQPHRMRNNPKGLTIMSILFRHPVRGERVLELPQRESDRLATAFAHFPRRLFASTDRLRNAFTRLFAIYDSQMDDADIWRLEMRGAALELLLAILDASSRDPRTFPDKFKAVARRMEDQPGEDYPISEIAEEIDSGLFPSPGESMEQGDQERAADCRHDDRRRNLGRRHL